MLEPGKIIDRYVVESLVGTGGTAVVYRVKHASLGTLHALKVLSVTSDVIRDRMLQEGRVQAALRHLNVVAVTDVLDVEGSPGLLMEYIEGPSLDRALKEYRLPLEAAEVLFLGIVAGVRQAHHHGLVHRDLKPANVLLAKTPDGFVPKVTDFGLAKVLVEASAGQGHTRSGIAMGTPAYMSSEQIRDARSVDQRADIFSLGCMLYELATHQRAFPGEDAITIYNNVISGEYIAPKRHVPDLPDRIDRAIHGCLVMDRDQRIPDCDTLLQVLRGELEWAAPDVGDSDTIEVTESIPLPLSPNAPAMHVAARHPNGETPAPAPSRSAGPRPSGGMGLGTEIEDMPTDLREGHVPPEQDPLYASLGPDDSIVPRDSALDDFTQDVAPPAPARRSALSVLMWLAVIGLLGVAMLVVTVGVGSTLLFGNRPVTAPTNVNSSLGEPNAPLDASEPVAPSHDAAAIGDPSKPSEPAAAGTPPAPKAPAAPKATTPKAPAAPAAPAAPKATTETAPAPTPPTRPRSTLPAPSATGTTPDLGPSEPMRRPAAAPLTVKLLSKPPTATVLVDGADLGRTNGKFELGSGSRRVELRLGDDVARFEIDVSASGENKWCYSFPDAKSYAGSCP